MDLGLKCSTATFQFKIRAFKNAFGSVGNPACPRTTRVKRRVLAPSFHHLFFTLRCVHKSQRLLNYSWNTNDNKKDLSAAKDTTQRNYRNETFTTFITLPCLRTRISPLSFPRNARFPHLPVLPLGPERATRARPRTARFGPLGQSFR